MFLLVVSWALRLAIDAAPFRFPAPVIAMIIFFVVLLILESLSHKFPGNTARDSQDLEEEQHKERKRFTAPVLAFLAPPCEFCLRNM